MEELGAARPRRGRKVTGRLRLGSPSVFLVLHGPFYGSQPSLAAFDPDLVARYERGGGF